MGTVQCETMSKAFILIPGARLPSDIAEKVIGTLTAEQKTALLTIQGDNPQLVTQRFVEGPYRRAPHRLWLWKVLTREGTYPREAPWHWLSLGARELPSELWCLSALKLDVSTQTIKSEVLLSDETYFAASMALQKVLRDSKFQLQMWDGRWFVTRKDNYPIVSAPLESILGQKFSSDWVVGEAKDDLWKLLTDLREVLPPAAREAGIDAFWLWGGGRDCRFNPPTLVRSVASNDPVILGWANASGILNTFLISEKKGWPEDTAPGDVIVHLSGLYTAWLAGDWETWKESLDVVAAEVDRYRTKAKTRDKEVEIFTVCFGEAGAVTLAPQEPTLMQRLFKNKKPNTLLSWYIDSYDSNH